MEPRPLSWIAFSLVLADFRMMEKRRQSESGTLLPARGGWLLINPKKPFHHLVRFVEDHIEGQELAVVKITVPAFGIDGHDVESVVEEDDVPRRIAEPHPAGFDEVFLISRGSAGSP